MAARTNLEGQRFGKLTVGVYRLMKPSGRWECSCDCGNIGNWATSDLTSGKVSSCGCAQYEQTSGRAYKHGSWGTKTWVAWRDMISRCENPHNESFKHYGGRGISIDPRWKNFKEFLEDMGECPSGLTLEREEVNGNYEKLNCIWATQKAQHGNTRRSIRVVFQGRKMCLKHACAIAGISYHSAKRSAQAGADFETYAASKKKAATLSNQSGEDQ